MVKKLKYILLLIPFLFVVNVNAEVLNGNATIGSGVIYTGSSYIYTPNVNLSYGSENVYRYSTDYNNPFVLGSRYVVGLNLGSTGANTFSGVVEIPVAIYSTNTISVYNRPTSSAFHVSLGNFYDWSSLTYNVTDFSSNCGTYYNLQTNSPYDICIYRVGFTAKSSSMIYGGTNLSWGIYDTSNANNLVFQPLGGSWGNNNGGWIFPVRPSNIEGGSNIAPYYILSYGNNISETLLQQQIQQQQTIINQNQTIINQQNSNTNSIINNQDSNTQDIINNQNTNTQDIINNQNSNTQQQIESQEVCQIVDVNYIQEDNNLLNNYGNVTSNSAFGITKYFKINKNSNIKVIYNQNFNSYLWFYDINKQKISGINNSSLVENTYLTIPSNASYVRFTIVKAQNKPQFEICNNGNQALNDSVNDLNDSITDTSSPDTDSSLSDMSNSVASYTPISDLITMPLTLFRAYINGINSTCSPVNLGNLYGTNLSLPCLNLEQRLGSDLWSGIDAICCIFLIYEIAMLFVSAFDGITSLRDDFESLYQPRHADVGYVPKHGGGN